MVTLCRSFVFGVDNDVFVWRTMLASFAVHLLSPLLFLLLLEGRWCTLGSLGGEIFSPPLEAGSGYVGSDRLIVGCTWWHRFDGGQLGFFDQSVACLAVSLVGVLWESCVHLILHYSEKYLC